MTSEEIIISYDRYYNNSGYILLEYEEKMEFKNLKVTHRKHIIEIYLSKYEYNNLRKFKEFRDYILNSEIKHEITFDNYSYTFYIDQYFTTETGGVYEMLYDQDYIDCILDRLEFYVRQEILPIIEECLGKEIKYKKRSNIIYTWNGKNKIIIQEV